jgi:hypothetical protein
LLAAATKHKSKHQVVIGGLHNGSQAWCVIKVTSAWATFPYYRTIRLSARAHKYSRTTNDNGSVNSRCLYCFVAISTEADSTSDLDRVEARHICPEKALAHLLARRHTLEFQQQNE